MPNFDTQTLVALVCVAVALVVLCRRTLLWWRGQSAGCGGGGCRGCGSEPARLKVSLTVLSDADELVTKRMENEK